MITLQDLISNRELRLHHKLTLGSSTFVLIYSTYSSSMNRGSVSQPQVLL